MKRFHASGGDISMKKKANLLVHGNIPQGCGGAKPPLQWLQEERRDAVS